MSKTMGSGLEQGPETPILVDKRALLAKRIGMYGLALTLILTITIVISGINKKDSSNQGIGSILDKAALAALPTAPAAVDTSWVPSGFNVWTADANIAWQWVTVGTCTGEYGCVTAKFVSQVGCPNGLYVATNWLDKQNNVISYSNATLPSLLPLQTAKLQFDDINGDGQSARIAEINCR